MSHSKRALDTIRAFVYKAGLFGCAASIAAAALLGVGTAHAAEYALGVRMPKKATAEGPNRYTVPGSLKETVKFFKKRFKRAPHVFIDAVDHPKAKVVHIQSRDSDTAWSGINIALYGKQVHVYVIPRAGRSMSTKSSESAEGAND